MFSNRRIYWHRMRHPSKREEWVCMWSHLEGSCLSYLCSYELLVWNWQGFIRCEHVSLRACTDLGGSVNTRVPACLCACVCADTDIFVLECMCPPACTCVHVHAHMCTTLRYILCVCTRVSLCAKTCTHECRWTCTHVPVYVHACMALCVLVCHQPFMPV